MLIQGAGCQSRRSRASAKDRRSAATHWPRLQQFDSSVFMLAMKGNVLHRLLNYTLTNPEGYDSYGWNIFFPVEHNCRLRNSIQKVAASPPPQRATLSDTDGENKCLACLNI